MKLTKSFYKHLEVKKRIVISKGGTSSSKTYSIIQLLILRAIKYQDKGLKISIVAETLPALKRGAMTYFFSILKEEGIYDEKNHNKTDNIYKIGKSTIEFWSADKVGSNKASRRDILYINEINYIKYDVFTELEVRTKDQIFLDYNPVSPFWITKVMDEIDTNDYELLTTTYLDNEFLDVNIVKSIEAKRNNIEWWNVYGLGLEGTLEGTIYTNWEQCDEFPADTKWNVIGMDFGFSNDPTAIINIGMSDGDIYLDEICYSTGLLNKDINEVLQPYNLEIVADSADPKSILELSTYGNNVQPCVKGPDSIRFGIDVVKSYKLFVTSRSINIIKELRNYKWKRNRNGEYEAKPEDNWNHALDAIRYGITYKSGSENNNDWYMGERQMNPKFGY